MKTQRLTLAQALVKHLAALRIETHDGQVQPYCGGVFTIFGHGNVAGMGEALVAERDRLPTFRAHNEQTMAHAAIAYAKASFRERIMAVSTSIGPGATNLVTAAAVAHVNRLPVLLLPGDVFASRRPDPVLQQIESFAQGDVSASDCFRPVTRYFDRLTRPEHILTALPRAIQMMTDPANCGPACLSLPQDVQAMAFDCPESFLQPELLRFRRPPADPRELASAAALLRQARQPLIVVGGGVLYSQAWDALRAFAEAHGVPVVESHGGKSSLPWDHPLNLGAIGVDGVSGANELARSADLVFAVGTRLQDFTTGSHALFAHARLLSLNVQPYDAGKWSGSALVADARTGLEQLAPLLQGWAADPAWTERARQNAAATNARIQQLTTQLPQGVLPYDAEVIGAVRDSAAELGLDSAEHDVALCAAGTLPAELHKLWRASRPGNYHMEYGYSCMGYEVAGGLGVKMARPEQESIVFVGDGSYMMANSELATSLLLGKKMIVVILDNRGYGCIERLQLKTGSPSFNNMLDDCVPEGGESSQIDFAMHARAMGADSVHVKDVAELKAAMVKARAAKRTQVIVIDTTHTRITDGGCWWEVAIPEVSDRAEVQQARAGYEQAQQGQRL
ncbi:MAG: 3D-(3,5/4)-trihydroxycyclohexane-1,2-dione acylhydrolase (decyclizing) [Burkholderiales bacterium RIFOXYC12_FULL_65_23]|uniref:3D-(3,5/4)-trihydroxycyclohexane-1,2-dione acylhydrolase (decyclizing) n=1 Tax=Malikia spinosa TaxID=86180 RepID=UPI0008AFB53F|nr:3D-(3,5/4)-trihydroxycyclohexane-1,2-dione acylhydrolase (decyclizing) [Malikia spinosa]OGB68522.1 MAG: 3D-(3,5/4)-trihydroxycyclohexane-1,2-dione acylhydrolase (decyclizing) [Burkholderiales bacterium RIFOXYC12_FULL_65_23]